MVGQRANVNVCSATELGRCVGLSEIGGSAGSRRPPPSFSLVFGVVSGLSHGPMDPWKHFPAQAPMPTAARVGGQGRPRNCESTEVMASMADMSDEDVIAAFRSQGLDLAGFLE